MQKPTQNIKPEQIIEIIIKWRWLIIIPFCISMIVGICLAIMLPKMYQASTLILIQPQKVPTSFVQSIVSSNIESRISTIQQQIMSRTNLEKIIKDFKLFSGPEYKKMYLEDKLGDLRKRIKVEVTEADIKKVADAFSISFIGKDPEKVMRIANTLAAFFINENLKVREAQAVGTSDFLDNELNSIRKRLETFEENLKKYRMKYMGGLPEQLETNLRLLDRLQEQMSSRQETLTNTKNRLLVLENQIQPESMLGNTVSAIVSHNRPETVNDDISQLEALKKNLEALRAKYTDRHPDVIRLKNEIQTLDAKIKNPTDKTEKLPQPDSAQIADRAYKEKKRILLANQKKELKGEINGLNQEIKKIADQIKYYQQLVENTPKREQELLSLKRDYHNVQEAYNSMLNRKLEAKIAVNMEKKQKGEQFRILDSANLPEKPVSPNMKKLFMLVLAAGLGVGGGLIFLFEYLNTSFKTPEDIESFIGVNVIATVPEIYGEKDKKWQKINMVFSGLFIIISFMLLTGFALLTLKGVDQTMALAGKFIK